MEKSPLIQQGYRPKYLIIAALAKLDGDKQCTKYLGLTMGKVPSLVKRRFISQGDRLNLERVIGA